MKDSFVKVIDDFLKHVGDGLYDDIVEDIMDFLFGNTKD